MRATGLLALLVLGCNAPPSSERAHVWSPADVAAAAHQGTPVAGLDAAQLVAIGGAPIPWLSPPHTAAPALQPAGSDGLVVIPAFADGQTAAYVVAEVWQKIPDAWLQPWYSLYQAPASGGPPVRLATVDGVIDVVPPSFFDSPFWQLIDVTIPPPSVPR